MFAAADFKHVDILLGHEYQYYMGKTHNINGRTTNNSLLSLKKILMIYVLFKIPL